MRIPVIDLANQLELIARMKYVTRRFVHVNSNTDAAEYKSHCRKDTGALVASRQADSFAQNDSREVR